MKTYNFIYLFFFCAVFFGGSVQSFSQTGINTTNPRTTLEVAGEMEITGNYEIGEFNALEDTDTSTFLVQDNYNKLKGLDVSDPTGAALGYLLEYVIVNPEKDWVKDFDTGIPANDYVLVTISASFDTELGISSSAGAVDNSSLPYTATFVKGNKWHIIADYPMVANLDPNAIGTWRIQTLIFSKDLSKQFGIIDIEMLNASTGAAISPIID
jgi:hypothetical protein